MFSAPLWLLGLIALAIPLILHLWSRRPRNVIRVGTLKHVELTADARSWSARLTEPLLLAVRLALLITLIFALAGLRLPARRSAGSGGSLVLVDPALLSPDVKFAFLDSIRREHEPVRLLVTGLPKYQLDTDGKLEKPFPRSDDIWAVLAEASDVVGPRGVLHVVARPRLAALAGTRPQLRSRVEWHAPPPPLEARWLQARWRDGDTTLAIMASGDARGSSYMLGRTVAGCDGCPQLTGHVIAIRASDSIANRRIAVAIDAISKELALPLKAASTLEGADAVVTDLPIDDSLLALGTRVILLSPATVAAATLVDSLWANWPWSPLGDLSDDPRELSLAQMLPAVPGASLPPLGDPEATRRGLLLLALLLFAIERWLATRPGRSEV